MTVTIGNIRFIESIPAKGVGRTINNGAGTNRNNTGLRLHIMALLCNVKVVVVHNINSLELLDYCFYARRVRKGKGEAPPLGDEGSGGGGVAPIVPYQLNELGMPG